MQRAVSRGNGASDPAAFPLRSAAVDFCRSIITLCRLSPCSGTPPGWQHRTGSRYINLAIMHLLRNQLTSTIAPGIRHGTLTSRSPSVPCSIL
jgi:hypothetical protein